MTAEDVFDWAEEVAAELLPVVLSSCCDIMAGVLSRPKGGTSPVSMSGLSGRKDIS